MRFLSGPVGLASRVLWVFCYLAAISALVLAGPRPVLAGSIVYEGFDYDVGAKLNTQAGGTGWGAAWTGATGVTIAKGSLMDPTGTLATLGNSAQTPDGATSLINRDVASNAAFNPPADFWVSFLLQPTSAVGGGQNGGLGLLVLGGSSGTSLAIGKDGSTLDYSLLGLSIMGGQGGAKAGTNVNATQNTTVFLVTHVVIPASGNSTATLYVDPTPGKDAPMGFSGMATKNDVSFIGTLGVVGLQTGTGWKFDEIRIGTTFADVTPKAAGTPEPSTFTMLATAGVFGMIVLVQRRRSRAERTGELEQTER
jgi:hypothetical protein